MATPAVRTRTIGSTYIWMMAHANAPVMHMVDIRMIVFAQWLIVNPRSQSMLFAKRMNSQHLLTHWPHCGLSNLPVCALHRIWRPTDSARQQVLRFAASLHQPPTQTFVMNRTHVARAFAWLDQRLTLIRIIANPTVSPHHQKRLTFFGWCLLLQWTNNFPLFSPFPLNEAWHVYSWPWCYRL